MDFPKKYIEFTMPKNERFISYSLIYPVLLITTRSAS